MRGRNQIRLILLGILVFANYLLWVAISEASNQTLRIDFLDVGQGDAILIQTPTGENILVDGGPDDSVVTRLGEILPLWDHKLDLVIATHWDADHITGLVTVLERYQVAEVLVTPPSASLTKIGTAWQQAIAKVPLVNYADATDDYQWGKVSWDTLLPLTENNNLATDSNNSCIVAELIYKSRSLLLTGDMEAPEESLLMQIYPAISADVLKVAHHGSKYSSTAELLDKLHLQAALISVGAHNSYGHPSPDTLNRLQAEGADIYRTDQDGTIEVIFGDSGYSIKANGQKKFY